MFANRINLILKGKTLSPGLGKGRTFVYRDILTRMDEFFDIQDAQVEEESQRFVRAVDKVSRDLDALASRVKKRWLQSSPACSMHTPLSNSPDINEASRIALLAME